MRAIVVGGGIAGLAAAKVLASHYREVILLAPKAAPQGKHLHVLLKQGQDLLEEIFPGIKEKLRAQGCPEVDWARDTVWENHRGRFPRYESGVKTLSMSRTFLESLLHEELLKETAVKVVTASLKKIISPKEVITDDGRSYTCALLVLAAGANFPLEHYLGRGTVARDRSLRIDLTYRSVLLHRDEVKLPDCKQYYYQMVPPHSTLGGVISPVENGMVLATLIEQEKEGLKDCGSFESFLERARELPCPAFHQSIASATPVGAVQTYRKKSIHDRKLDVESVPSGVLLMGDLLASLNPVFGQGMTMSLLQARLLKRMLKEKNFSGYDFYRSCKAQGLGPGLLSRFGSSGGVMIELLLGACQKYPFFHKRFLHFLHHPGGSL